MCNLATCSHDHLDDDLSDLLGGAPSNIEAADAFAREALAPRKVTSTVTFEERCEACGGSGRFRSYSGRIVGECFKCKGAGVRRYKQSAEQREKARAAAAAKRDAKDAEAKAACEAWLDANPAEAEWLREAAGRGFEFAASLWEALRKYGRLTEKQEAAVRNATAKSAARKAQWAAEKAAREANAAPVQIDRIATALATAKASGLKWPKLRLAYFIFSPAGESSRNAGAIYVKTHDDVYLGKIVDGRFTRSRDCDAATEEAILTAAADPLAAAVAYGLQTGVCACCGRELTNAESVALGIGPVCRSNWGF